MKQRNLYIQRELKLTPILKLKLQSLRDDIKTRGGTFKITATDVLDIPIEKISGLNPSLSPSAIRQQNTDATKLLEAERRAVDAALLKDPSLRSKIPLFKLAPKPTMKTWDWRIAGEVTGVRRQLGGTCWAYGPVAALEASMLIRNNQSVNASEQYVITNSGGGSIAFPPGGDPGKSMAYLVAQGTVKESDVPDGGTQGTPDPSRFKPYRGISWGIIANGGKASIQQLKEALCEHGPVTTCLYATGAFQGYAGSDIPVNDGFENNKIDHVVLLIGWDDNKQSWLIKNSWGENWGDECGMGTVGGYAWVKYGCRNIGSYSMWIHAHAEYMDLLIYRKALTDLKVDLTKLKLPSGIR